MGKIILEEQIEPSTPSSNKVAIYPKAGGNVYKISDNGIEEEFITTSSGCWSGDIPTISGIMTVLNGLIINYS